MAGDRFQPSGRINPKELDQLFHTEPEAKAEEK
jgi:hypothetical protein